MPANARYLPHERPRTAVSVPRFLEPRVIETLRRPESLALIADPAHRLAIMIMMDVGLRAGHTCALHLNCLADRRTADEPDKWALSFVDTKSNRNMLPPISPALAASIREQQTAVVERSSGGAPDFLFYNPRALKTHVLAPERLNTIINRWVNDLDLRNTDGTKLVATPHQFRHTFATDLLNRGVEITVVKELLGHRSLASTEIYATVTDQRMREQWEKSRAVDVQGDAIGLGAGSQAEADWLLHRMQRAIQPVPNGHCSLPSQQSCPHANACLDRCDHFATTVEFLPVLIQQRDSHQRFVSQAELDGHLRIAEINRRPMENLDRIIRTIEEDSLAAES